MSEFLAEAQVLIRPDTTAFRVQLLAQLSALKIPPINIPVAAASSGLAAAAGAAAGLAASQKIATVTTAELATAERLLNTQSAKGVVLLEGLTAATAQKAGADAAAATAAKTHAASSAKLNATLLGLRTAVGGAAVIGLGALSLAAIVAGKALRATIAITAQFEAELFAFQAIVGATADEMVRVSETAKQLGADVRLPGVSASDAATAMTELAKAGLSVQDALDGAKGVLQLATAAQLSNADASQIAANALNSFGLAGDQAVRVADVLANAANAAQGSIADFGIAMRQTSAVARQVGLSLEDTTALLSLFAKNGLSGSDAGTSLRVALIRLTAPTKAAATEIRNLGLNIRDAQGNFRPDVFAQFGRATEGLSPAARDAAASLIFGTDAIRALSIGAREGAAGLRLMQFEIDQQGTAAEVAEARTKGLAGSFGNLQNQASTAALTTGNQLAPALQEVVDVSAFAVSGINEIAEATGRLAEKIDELPGEGWGRRLFGEFTLIPVKLIDKSAEELAKLNEEMQLLQDARIGAEEGGLSDLADQLTGDIERVREEIDKLDGDSQKIGGAIAAPLRKARDALREFIQAQADAGKDTTKYVQALIRVNLAIDDYERAAKLGVTATNSVASGFEQVDRNAQAAAISVNTLTSEVKNLTRESVALGDQLLKLQAEGGTPQQQIAILQADNRTQQQLIAEAESGGRTAGDITAIRAARNKIIANNNEIESLQAEIKAESDKVVSDAKAAASEAKTAATAAQQARDEQFEALADLFGGRQENIEDAITTAGIKGNLDAQLRLNKALIASLSKERSTLLARLRTLNVSATVRKQIIAAIDAAIQDAKDDRLRLQQQLAENAQDAIATKQANILEGIGLDISLAQTNENVGREIALRKRLIAALKNQQSLVDEGTLEYKRLRNAIAEENAAIAELQNEQKKQGNLFASQAFDFLQKQQGFAANLLGNLIPGFATGGLVGGSSQPSPTSSIQSQSAAFKTASPTYGQAATEVDILKQVLQVLREIRAGRSHPEANYQRATQHSNMDGVGGV